MGSYVRGRQEEEMWKGEREDENGRREEGSTCGRGRQRGRIIKRKSEGNESHYDCICRIKINDCDKIEFLHINFSLCERLSPPPPSESLSLMFQHRRGIRSNWTDQERAEGREGRDMNSINGKE